MEIKEREGMHFKINFARFKTDVFFIFYKKKLITLKLLFALKFLNDSQDLKWFGKLYPV